MPFTFKELDLPGVVLVQPKVFSDERGSFAEVYKLSAFAARGIGGPFVQFNQSVSRRNVLRGLHYQLPPAAQGKLVRVEEGGIYDAAVDIRAGSESFGQWVSAELSAARGDMLYIPPGFAHGFCVLSGRARVFYYATAEYAPSLERGIAWNDPDLAINWPVGRPVLSDRDRRYPPLKRADIVGL